MDLDEAQNVVATASPVWCKHIVNQPVLFSRSSFHTEIVFSIAEPSFADAMTIYHLIADALTEAIPPAAADATTSDTLDSPLITHELVLR